MIETLTYISVYFGLFLGFFYLFAFLNKVKEKEPEFKETGVPKVSIIIPAYNEEKGIACTIESALNLNYPKNKLEVIVVDDGSKDKTYEIASQFVKKGIKLFTKPNGGKGTALNLGIKNSTGEVIVTMDADNTRVNIDALKHMVSYFSNPNIVCVAPVMAVYKPKGILQKVQQVEYLFGIFLRKVFYNLNSIHVTPGAFSAYRKSFFKKYGGFDENNLTEDLEMALRIQYHNYGIANSTNAIVYTVTPNTFVSLLKQRRRWFAGLAKNLVHYNKLFSIKYKELGTIILPSAVFGVIIGVTLTPYVLIKSMINMGRQFNYWQSINYQITSSSNFYLFSLSKYFWTTITDPKIFFLTVTLLVFVGYLLFARIKLKEALNVKLSFVFFMVFYTLLFALWWTVSIFYMVFNRKISWR
ncbi:MAG: glycosyltransferase [Candidatus Pacearchaeota archaeon]|jgi:cellulose synthase/poly-beta-1,6-N-acetylglucosamine synthase-like glycosyltransferase